VDDEIQFGEVEEASPQTNLRPDRNKHYAVVEYGSPNDRDLPIFVDLDVLADMEEHALSDTSVELGGVLLGGTYTDNNGRPFIVVTDSLRARHYESTKGSFTFTHDTWSAITREREEFPEDLAMVGWYHTHPDWGVFLSGMDMFICDNFFNKALDLAYVIDPCRGDRGMFQWTGNPNQRVRRTGGFFVTASRFRAAELEHYVAELSGSMPATTTRSQTGGYGGAPVVHLHQPPQPTPPAWQVPAVVGMLCLQFCLLALVAWKMVDPLAGGAAGSAASELSDLKEAIAAQDKAAATLEKAKLRTEVVDHVLSEMKGTGPGFIERMQEKFDQTQRLSADVEARDSQVRELQATVAEATNELKTSEAKSRIEQDKLADRLEELDKQIASLTKNNESLTARLEKYEPKKTDGEGEGEAASGTSDRSVWWYVGGGVLAAIVVAAGAWWGATLLGEKVPEAEDGREPKTESDEASASEEPMK
jgi:proteasome lid subunit RPN8/RPN11